MTRSMVEDLLVEGLFMALLVFGGERRRGERWRDKRNDPLDDL